MGLGDMFDSDGEPKGNRSTSSNSGGGGGGNFGPRRDDGLYQQNNSDNYPQVKEWYPYALIVEDGYGGYEYVGGGQNYPFEKIKTSKSSGWKFQSKEHDFRGIPPEVEKFWSDSVQFKSRVRAVKDTIGIDLFEEDNNGVPFIRRKTEKAIRAINESAKQEGTARRFSHTRECGVCGTELHIVMDSYEEIGNRIVCKNHSASQLVKAGLI